MDENPTVPGPTTCTCCGRRNVRRLEEVRVTTAGRPVVTAVCPECDLAPAELQGWTTDLLREDG